MNKFFLITTLLFTLSYPNFAFAEEKDMFSILVEYSENLPKTDEKTNFVIVSDGNDFDLDKAVEDKINKYKNSLKTKDGDSINKGSLNIGSTPEKYKSEESYFVGTTDFTKLSVSEKDTALNKWSAIKESYAEYDDGKEDNLTIIATAYTSAAEENGGYEGMNAIGGKLGPGVIAAPKDIKFHSKIRLSGLGIFNVEDRGGAIVRISEDIIRIDVWMDSYKEAMSFGKRVYKGRILK